MANKTYRALEQVIQSPGVRRKLADNAQRIAARGRGIAASEGVDTDITVESGTRPQGRPYARIVGDAEHEYGSSRTARLRILGRAVRG